MGATGPLRAAFAKAASLPAQEQDEIARLVVARVSGDTWVEPTSPEFPRIAAIGRAVNVILPKNSVARTIALAMCSFILFVQAPIVLLLGVGEVIRAAKYQPTGAKEIRQTAIGIAGANNVVGLPGESLAPEATAAESDVSPPGSAAP